VLPGINTSKAMQIRDVAVAVMKDSDLQNQMVRGDSAGLTGSGGLLIQAVQRVYRARSRLSSGG
jgi:hypothetical protein